MNKGLARAVVPYTISLLRWLTLATGSWEVGVRAHVQRQSQFYGRSHMTGMSYSLLTAAEYLARSEI